MPSFKIFVMQDGGEFYSFDSEDMDNEILSLRRSYPNPVTDMATARKARTWFESLCSKGQKIHWVGGSIGLRVTVSTVSNSEPDPIHKDIDWSNSSDKTWLMNHLHWAMNNCHEVTLTPESY